MSSTLADRRAQVLGSAYRLFYDEPVELVRGEGVHLFDARGQAYLDVYNNVPHVGHCHPHVVEAVSRQLSTLNTHTRYLHEGLVTYAERLLARMPDAIDKAMFACTGTEAVELSLRLARAWSGADGIICLSNAYHGNSTAVSQISPEIRGIDRGDHVATAKMPDVRDFASEEDAAAFLVQQVEAAISALRAKHHEPAAFIIDTVMSSEGICRAPRGSLAAIASIMHSSGGVFIADEVQAGFGRPGDHFWGFQWQGVSPDIVTMGKPMGNGYPVSAVAIRSDVLERFSARTGYFNTFAGSPVAAAAANAVMDVIEQESLQENARISGQLLRSRLREMGNDFECVGQVRGNGLFNGLELIVDRESRQPASELAARVVNDLARQRILVGRTGVHENVIKMRPPMVFGPDHVDQLVEGLGSALRSQIR